MAMMMIIFFVFYHWEFIKFPSVSFCYEIMYFDKLEGNTTHYFMFSSNLAIYFYQIYYHWIIINVKFKMKNPCGMLINLVESCLFELPAC